jgi:hypothetical protein
MTITGGDRGVGLRVVNHGSMIHFTGSWLEDRPIGTAQADTCWPPAVRKRRKTEYVHLSGKGP